MPSHNSLNPTVLVIGAGPVGLLTALRLAKASIPVTILDRDRHLKSSARAIAYHPPAVAALDRAGILDKVDRYARQGTKICWRKASDKSVLREVERGKAPGEKYGGINLGQDVLCKILLGELERCEAARVMWGYEVVSLTQDGDGVSVGARNGDDDGGVIEEAVFRARYVVGADGGRSAVRRLSGIEFEGFTYPDQLVSTDIVYPFEKFGWTGASFMIDKKEWGLIAQYGPDSSSPWRVAYGERAGSTRAEILNEMAIKLERLLPGNPKPGEYKIVDTALYTIHQRCASTFREGRVLLAGDAAHITNPFGALGLTTGLCDADAISEAFISVVKGGAGDEMLERYATSRRGHFREFVDPTAQANKRRLHDFDVEAAEGKEEFMKSFTAPAVELRKE